MGPAPGHPLRPDLDRTAWTASGLLLLATMLNYMDRQTLANLAPRITAEFGLNNEQYGLVESAFGYAFAAGSLVFGFLADRLSVRWLYPAILVAWSVIGALTGLAEGFRSLLACRIALGFFEAGHWPCALVTTQALVSGGGRLLGNSILQSGASLGAIFTPVIIRFLVAGQTHPGAWRPPFVIVGALGALWAVLWLVLLRRASFPRPRTHPAATASGPPWWHLFGDRRFWAVAGMVICINIPWHLVRAWLPKFLVEGRGYPETAALDFNAAYYLATDLGCLAAGAAAVALVRRGRSEHGSRLAVFGACAAGTLLTTLAAVLPAGWPLLGVLLLVGAASLGLFPCYYSFVQALDPRHVGKATGILSTIGWLAASPVQTLYGRLIDRTGSFDLGLALAGWAPLLAWIGMLWLWRRDLTPGSRG
jgi:ACS family hexuronate transporter-like MFS transporter